MGFIPISGEFALGQSAATGLTPVSSPRGGGHFDQAGRALLLDSGWVENRDSGSGVKRIFRGSVHSDDAMWLRIRFSDVQLGGEIGDPKSSYLLLTSELDGAVQQLYFEHLEQWAYRSAYFNGDTVRVEIYAAPGTGPNRVAIQSLEVGEPGFLDRSICGSTDDRVPADDPASARMLPGLCTAWLVNDRPSALMSAGHCAPQAGAIIEFNVPESTIGGSMVHPSPSDQYPVDLASVQTQVGGASTGNDWMSFGVFPNSNTGMMPLEAQGFSYRTATSLPPVDGRNVRVGGYGAVVLPVPLTRNYVYSEHVGELIAAAGNSIQYNADTTGGNSGSAVVDLVSGLAVAVHTNGGCNTNGFNRGTATKRPELVAALANPRGAAASTNPVVVTFPRPRPATITPNGGTQVRARFKPSATRSPLVETATLHVFDGASWTQVAMTPTSNGVAIASFPAASDCAPKVQYFFSVQNNLGETEVWPSAAPDRLFEARVSHAGTPVYATDFATTDGWVSSSAAGLASGSWKSNQPIFAARGAPGSDADGTGRCLVTGPGAEEDVDAGLARVSSPSINIGSAADPVLSFAAWYTDTNLIKGALDLQIWTNVQTDWQSIDLIAPTDGWETRVYRLWDYLQPASRVRVRFVATDETNRGIVEAAVDALRIDDPACGGCVLDLDGDGVITFNDVSLWLALWDDDQNGDLNGDGVTDFADLMLIISALGNGCP